MNNFGKGSLSTCKMVQLLIKAGVHLYKFKLRNCEFAEVVRAQLC